MDDERPLSYGKKRTNSEYDNRSYKRQNTNYGHSVVSSKTIDTLYRILCPIKKIGGVLGKGGDIVNAIREETHAKIRVTDSIPGSDDRAIIVFSYAQKQEEINRNQDVSDSPFGSDANDMKPHCSAQDALLKIHDRIAADEYIRGGVVHENAEPLDDVTARILVPNNQVGCLLGKGGNIIQKLRHETTASIRIISSEHLPPCAMNTDELVQISGKQIIVRRALYEISTLLHQHPRKEIPPLEDIISASNQQLYPSGPAAPLSLPHENPMLLSRYAPPEQWFDGYRNESSSHGPGSFNRSSIRDGIPEEFSIKVLCATEKIGSVIGKSGANVRQLERQTGARIHVEDTNPEDKERAIVVSSKEALSNPISPTIEAVLQLQRRTGEVSEKGTITTRLLVSSSKVGCLLGQGGHVIQEMRRRTRADIRVFSKSEKPKYASADEELVQISGNENVAETALSEVASRLRTRSLQGATAVDPLVDGPDHRVAASENFSRRQLSTDIGGADPVLYDYSMGYDYPKGSDYRKSYDHLRSHEYHKSYDHSKGYDYTKSYDYPKYYDYPKESDYTNRYDYPKDAGPPYNTQGYPGSLRSSGYSDIRSFVEIKTPKSSVLAMGGGNVADVHQVMPNASWRYLDYSSR